MKRLLFGGLSYAHGDILAVVQADFQKYDATGRLLQTPRLFYVRYDEMMDAMAISAISWEVAEAISTDKMAVALDRIGWSMSTHSTSQREMDADIDALPKGSVTTGRLRWNLRRVPRHGSHSEQEWDLEQEWEVYTSTGVVKVWRCVPNALGDEA